MPLLTLLRAALKPEGYTAKEAMLGDLVWMCAASMIFLIAMLLY